MSPLTEQELRANVLGMPRRYQLLDFLGIAFGGYMIYAGTTGRAPAWLTTALGGVAVFIHAQRFFYAPQDRAGLVRLLEQLDVSPSELLPLLDHGAPYEDQT